MSRLMIYAFVILLLAVCIDAFGGEDTVFFKEQHKLIAQQKTFVIQDILLDMEYIKGKIKNGTANDYDVYKLDKLEKRLTNIQNGNL